jgi:uncharacterized protein (UPF0548 family)
MFKLSKPTDQDIAEYLEAHRQLQFTYPEQGMTRQDVPQVGYVRDHNRVHLGTGSSLYMESKAALRRWQQFELGWVRVRTNNAPLKPDETVCLQVHFAFLWKLFACTSSPIKKFGFAYGTLPGHPESGEERFLIEWNSIDDSVWYDILAYSQPGNFAVALGYPFSRLMQKRFARESMASMKHLR